MTNAVVKHLTTARDNRGFLAAAQFPDNLPFLPARVFIVTSISEGSVRGGHAHRRCHQFLISASGSIRVDFDDDCGSQSVNLTSPDQGLYIPPLIWAQQVYLDSKAVLVVLASDAYDVDDYIDDRSEAERLRQQGTIRKSVKYPPRDPK